MINGGYWRTSAYFEYLTVPKAGHFVPSNYYSPSFAFLSDYIASKQLTCHKTTGDQCDVTQKRADAMNNCNENGTFNYTTGQCDCNDGYKFADCSKAAIDLSFNSTVATQNITGPGWFTMRYTGGDASFLSIVPSLATDVYVMKDSDSDPNNFVYDMNFMGIKSNMTLSSDDLGLTNDKGYAVAMYVHAVNETANKLLDASVDIGFTQGATVVSAFNVLTHITAALVMTQM